MEINTTEDLYNMLDTYTEGVNWNDFYTLRDKPAPFLKLNTVPDKCVVDFIRSHKIQTACEFGCGEGRNAIYLAKQGISVEACDLSEVAIQNARRKAEENKAEKVCFKAGNVFKQTFQEQSFDLVVDSGLFHHLPPHRRLQYREIVSYILKENGYFLLTCFAAGEEGADVIEDDAFYKTRQTGTAFTPERLETFWGGNFEIIELRKGKDIVQPMEWESSVLYIGTLKKDAKNISHPTAL